MRAAQTALNQIYGVPRNERPNPLTSRLRSPGLAVPLGVGLLVSVGVTALTSAGGVVATWGAGPRSSGSSWPPSLLTPFTDDVDLTDADRRAYRGYAAVQRFKGFRRRPRRFRTGPRPTEGLSVSLAVHPVGNTADVASRARQDGLPGGLPVHGGGRSYGVRSWGRRLRAVAVDAAGGPGRLRVMAVLAAVLGLSGADLATVSATTGQLERVFGVGNTQVGLLVSVVSLVGALGTVPVGVLTDRTRRTRLLAVSVLVWSVALVASGAATSYGWLIGARLVLGVATATTGPTVASLVGDSFPTGDRGRVYSLILAGELAGTGVGFVVAGEISSVLPWRFAFWWLAVPGLLLAWLVWRLPEPRRSAAAAEPDRSAGTAAGNTDARPDPRLVLHEDPAGRSVWWAVRYVLRVRTNVVIIIASALSYFFFAGLRSFAILFVTRHYGLAKPVASALVLVVGVGAVLGVIAGGRVSDRSVRRGHVRARIVVPAVCLLAVAPVLAPALLATTVAVALPLLTLGAALLGAANPPMDAARLDIMHPRLWGRAEAVRTVLRTGAEAAAPVLFGFVSDHVLHGLEPTFLVFLAPVLLAGVLVLPALRTYPRDVATAAAADMS